MSELAKWDSFYVIVGSAAGALIGLQFVVAALIAERPPLRAADAGAAFATPTIVHFCVVLLLAALAAPPGGPERARYLFRDGRGPGGDRPPNDWGSNFGGRAWTRVSEPSHATAAWAIRAATGLVEGRGDLRPVVR